MPPPRDEPSSPLAPPPAKAPCSSSSTTPAPAHGHAGLLGGLPADALAGEVVTLRRIVGALSAALDVAARGLSDHHRRVAYLSLRLGRALGLSDARLCDLFIAASLHDIGAVTSGERERHARFEVVDAFEHCRRGEEFLSGSAVLAPAARLVRHHHDRWSGSGGPWPAGPATPLESRILHLADRVDVLLEHDGSPLPQRRSIAAAVRELSGVDFDPQVCEAFLELSAREYLWLEMTSPELDHVLDDLTAGLPEVPLQGRATVEVAWVFSRFIDSHSRFTHRHSSGVAAVAVSLAARAGLSPRRQGQLAVAALLHDLGKVSVPGAILEKQGPLDSHEYELIRQHPYFTFAVLRRIPGFERINEWASFHHERMDGRGYPFGHPPERLSPEARILAVSDKLAALAEDRPYRPGLPTEDLRRILWADAGEGAVDGDVVALACDNCDELRAAMSPGGEGPGWGEAAAPSLGAA